MSSSDLYFEIKWINVIVGGFRHLPQFTQVLLWSNFFCATVFMYEMHSCCVLVVSENCGNDDTCSLNGFLHQLLASDPCLCVIII